MSGHGDATPADRTRLRPQPPSPLDPFVRVLLEWAATQEAGIAQPTAASFAATAGWDPAFLDALLTSARARGLVEPFRGRGARGRTLWRLSPRGRAWLAESPPLP